MIKNLFRKKVLTIIIIVISILLTNTTFAATGDTQWYAWSDMPDQSDQQITSSNLARGSGAGWISLNSNGLTSTGASTGYISTVSYKVTIDDTTGQWNGMGWSEYMGWIDFNPSGPYPVQPGNTISGGVKTDWSTGKTCGWARALAGGTSQSGGWDGWISMCGTSFGVTIDSLTGQMSGMAWGDMVMGWIDFSRVKIVINPSAPSVTISATPNTLTCPTSSSPRGQSATSTITWSGTNVDPGTCVATGGYGFTGTQSGTSGTVTVTGMNNAATPFSITCNKASGATGSLTVTASTAITCSNLVVNPSDACPLQGAVGNQTGTGPWQIQGVWYGLNNGICIVDQCIDNTQYPLTTGFQTLLPLNYQNVGCVCRPTGVCTDSRADNPGILGTNQVVDNNLCTYTAFCSIPANQSLPQCQTGPTGPLKPIYNER